MDNRKNTLIVLIVILFTSIVFAQENDESTDKLSKKDLIKETDVLAEKILEIEATIDDLSKESVKEKDIKWKVCLDDYLGNIKGVAASAVTAQTKLKELIAADKVEDAYSQLILLRGLSESAEKSMNDSMSCERQLTRVSSDTEIVVEINEEITGTVKKESVSDAMGVGFTDEFVAGTDKSAASGSGVADAAGVERTDVPGESPETGGGMSGSEQEAIEMVDVPDVSDASPTK
jgi:hypothetical protein